MAFTNTTIAAAFSASATSFKATSATGAAAGYLCKIEDELMVIESVSGTTINVYLRGCSGTKVVAHNSGAACTFGLASDFPESANWGESLAGPPFRDIKYYSAAGAITPPRKRDMVAVIGVGATGAHAMTLADPDADQTGLMIHIVSKSAQSHTVTLTTGYGGSNATDVFTFEGAIGDAITLIAIQGTWSYIGTNLQADETVGAAVA